jgi:MFS family permease
MFAVAISSNFNGFLVGMAITGLGFGVYMAVDLALVADVLPDTDYTANDLGVLKHRRRATLLDRAGDRAVILAISSGSHDVLYAAAGVCAIIGAVAILPVKRVR